MYNGVGVPTPRGTGTSGYVQKNASIVSNKGGFKYGNKKTTKQLVHEKKLNKEIAEHERLRSLEVECVKYQIKLESEAKYTEAEIDEKVGAFRKEIFEKDEIESKRVIVVDGKEVNEREYREQQEFKKKNVRMKEALNIGDERRGMNFGNHLKESEMLEMAAESHRAVKTEPPPEPTQTQTQIQIKPNDDEKRSNASSSSLSVSSSSSVDRRRKKDRRRAAKRPRRSSSSSEDDRRSRKKKQQRQTRRRRKHSSSYSDD